MVEDPRLIPDVSPEELLGRLAALRADAGAAAIAFDADGTLWSGDVGEELFEHAVRHEWLRGDARAELARVASEHGLDASGSANLLAERLFAAHRAGIVPDVPAFELMTWGYAGWRASEFQERTEAALRHLRFQDRVHAEVLPVLAWARTHAVRIAVISASPSLAVQAALRVTGLTVDHVAGGDARVAAGAITPGMARPLPYGPAKRTAALAVFGGAQWLASFGDSAYDFELLESARVGVLVRPKPALCARAAGQPTLCVLRPPLGT